MFNLGFSVPIFKKKAAEHRTHATGTRTAALGTFGRRRCRPGSLTTSKDMAAGAVAPDESYAIVAAIDFGTHGTGVTFKYSSRPDEPTMCAFLQHAVHFSLCVILIRVYSVLAIRVAWADARALCLRTGM